MNDIEINGITLRYVEKGNGDPILFVHGSASDYRNWQNQIEEFSKEYRVITYSRRYHWPNDQILEGADYSMMEHVDDLQAVIGSLKIAPVHLVGHSYGAFVCLLLALRESSLIRSLILAEPPAITLFVSNRPKPAEILKLLISRPRTAAAIVKFGARGAVPATAAAEKGDLEKALRIFSKAVLGPDTFDKLSESRLEQARVNTVKAEFTGSGFAPLNDDQLRKIKIPTLLINGEKSPALFHRLVDRLEELLLNTERIEIKGASHIMHEDNSGDYNAAVRAFLLKNK